jgi:hypothetical protein
MPTLIPVTRVEETNIPFIWYCSACEKVFGLERIPHSKPSITEIQRVNADFGVHCARDHAGQPFAGLEIRIPNEDASEAAARIVRDATKD